MPVAMVVERVCVLDQKYWGGGVEKVVSDCRERKPCFLHSNPKIVLEMYLLTPIFGELTIKCK